MKMDLETWKCLGIGLVVWIIACVSALVSRAEFSLGAEQYADNPSTGVIISLVVTEDGEYIVVNNE